MSSFARLGHGELFSMAESTDSREKRLTELKREISKRSFDRHASVSNHILDLPGDLQSPTLTKLVDGKVIQTIVVFPPQIQRGWDYVPKQALLFMPTGVIHLLASIWVNEVPKITYVKSCDIMYMRVTLALLYGLLEIVACGDGLPKRLNLEFNTVAWGYLSQPLRGLLQGSIIESDSLKSKVAYSPTVQRGLKELPLKFSNGVKIYGLLPGEHLKELVFQPSLRKRWFLLFRRNVIANTLLFLSTNYMGVIQDDLDVEQGWIVSHIPRDCIVEIQNRLGNDWNELIFQLKRGNQTAEYKISLRAEAAEAWRLKWIRHGGQWQDIQNQMEMR